MKKVIFFILGAAVCFIVVTLALSMAADIGSEVTIAISAAAALFGGGIASSIAGRAGKEVESGGTSRGAKFVIWILVIAIIAVAVIAFVGQWL